MAPVKAQKHRNKTAVKGLYVCQICGQDYVNKIDFANHTQQHEGVTYTFTECEKLFILIKALRIMLKPTSSSHKSAISVDKHLNYSHLWSTTLKCTLMFMNVWRLKRGREVMLCIWNISDMGILRHQLSSVTIVTIISSLLPRCILTVTRTMVLHHITSNWSKVARTFVIGLFFYFTY